MDRIPKEFHGDYSNAFAAAKTFRAGGWEALAEKYGPQTAHRLMALPEEQFSALLSGEVPQAPSQEPPPDPTAGAGYDPSQPYNPQFSAPPGMKVMYDPETGQYVHVQAPVDPAQKAMLDRMEKLETALQTQQTDTQERQQQARIKARIDESRDLEAQAVAKQLASLGIKANPTKMDWLGKVQEVDPMASWARGALQSMAVRMHQESLNPNDPEYDVKYQMGASPEVVQQVADAMKPFLTTASDNAVDDEVNRQQTMPQGAPPEGPGGRPQAALEEMSLEERNAQMLAELKAEGKALDIPDE